MTEANDKENNVLFESSNAALASYSSEVKNVFDCTIEMRVYNLETQSINHYNL